MTVLLAVLVALVAMFIIAVVIGHALRNSLDPEPLPTVQMIVHDIGAEVDREVFPRDAA